MSLAGLFEELRPGAFVHRFANQGLDFGT